MTPPFPPDGNNAGVACSTRRRHPRKSSGIRAGLDARRSRASGPGPGIPRRLPVPRARRHARVRSGWCRAGCWTSAPATRRRGSRHPACRGWQCGSRITRPSPARSRHPAWLEADGPDVAGRGSASYGMNDGSNQGRRSVGKSISIFTSTIRKRSSNVRRATEPSVRRRYRYRVAGVRTVRTPRQPTASSRRDSAGETRRWKCDGRRGSSGHPGNRPS